MDQAYQSEVRFNDSSSLVLLNMSFDDISGSIPSNNVFRLMGSSAANEGNPKLYGAPLKPCFASILIFDNKKLHENNDVEKSSVAAGEKSMTTRKRRDQIVED
ncbi:hypothetical protein SADUNF_Sadunf16G0253900 [Salix dunnii]|uniref:Uncharacterized protein n=1 Tax=Salix dunnii TaxID=1413687 RepID=A0A835MI10_9ROSI|nr:hypothetical protein SADUNF_Sadunf16G0253900 [Salix dunnii]